MRVLVVDDEPLVRRSLMRALRARGCEGFEAEDGVQGLEMWKQCQPELAFIDILMPRMSGPDLIRAVLPQLPKGNTPYIVLMSAYSEEDSQRLVVESGAHRFLQKPFDDLFAVIDRALDDAGRMTSVERKK